MTQAKKSVVDSALAWSRTDPNRVLWVMGKIRHQWKIAPSVEQRDWLLKNGFEIFYVITNGEITVDNAK